jgi:hypothetical protein
VDKALAIIKKNLLSIICAFVALLAMIALAYPLGGMREHFRGELASRTTLYTSAKTLLVAKRYLPIVDPDQKDPIPLLAFPNTPVIDKARAARETVQTQSNQMMEKALALNQAGHFMLVAPDLLPNPGDRWSKFRDAYRKEVREGLPGRLGAVMPPNQETINKRLLEMHKAMVEDQVITIGGAEANRAQLQAEYDEAALKLPDQLRQESATQKKLYMDPNTALSINQIMTNDLTMPTPVNIWYAQLSLWIEQDVADSIVAANSIAPNSNILNDAVKRIVEIKIPDGASAYVQSGAAPGGAAAAPAAAPGDDSASDVRDFSKSPTGHVCNDLYDVVSFSMILEVDQRQIPAIVHDLQSNKLMAVLTVNISGIDPVEADAQGFIYGTAPVVRLSMDCEALFMRKWTVPLMPDEVKSGARGGSGGAGGFSAPAFQGNPTPVPTGPNND